MLKKSKYIY